MRGERLEVRNRLLSLQIYRTKFLHKQEQWYDNHFEFCNVIPGVVETVLDVQITVAGADKKERAHVCIDGPVWALEIARKLFPQERGKIKMEKC